MTEFRVLGELDLRDTHGREVRSVLSASKQIALLTYLAAASPHALRRRDTLLALFWPEFDQEHARGALRQTLFRIRQALSSDAVINRGEEEIGINRDRFWCDAATFEALLDGGRAAEALEVYRGDLLQGFHLTGCLEFERWLDGERDRLRRRASQAAWLLATQSEAAGNAVEAAHWARRAVALAPDDEVALRRLIGLLDRMGDRTGAIREYEAFAHQLRRDYQADPAPETRQLFEVISTRVQPIRPAAEPPSTASSVERAPQLPAQRSRRHRTLALVALAVVFALGGALVVVTWPDGPVLDPKRVLVDVFENDTGDPALDPLGRVAADWIAQGLAQTGLAAVVPSVMVLGTVHDFESKGEVGRGPTRAKALAEATGSGLLVSGSYLRHGDTVAFQARVTDVSSGELVRGIDAVRARLDAPLEAVELLRRKVLGALATVLDPRLATWAGTASQPPSFEAYRLYMDGLGLYVRGLNTRERYREAVRHLSRAYALDSTFTAPLLWLVAVHRHAAEFPSADSLVRILQRRKDRLAPWDRAMVDYHDAYLGGDHSGAYEAAKRVVAIAPGTEWVYWLASAALALNRPREALDLLVGLDPERGWMSSWRPYWTQLLEARHMLGDYRGELRDVERARGARPDGYRLQEWRALVALGRVEQVTSWAGAFMSTQTERSWPNIRLFLTLILELRAHGQHAAAQEMLERTLAWYDQARPAEREDTVFRMSHGRALFLAGRYDEARSVLERLIAGYSEDPGRGTIRYWEAFGLLGIMAARRGDPLEAARISDLIEATTTAYHYGEHTVWRAAIAAHLGERERAMELLNDAVREGLHFTLALHDGYYGLDPLRGYPPFEEFLRPKG